MTQERLYMTHAWNDEQQAYLAVITEGHPRMGDELATVLTLELLPTARACRQWFKRMRRERPWETRQ
jgi:hypothetical protein